MLSLAKLEHFRVVARSGSFARAAGELGLSQSALSRSIASLETQCGGRLVERERGRPGVVLTAAGLELLEQADQLLRHARQVEESATGHRTAERVHVRFGIGPLLGRLLLSGALTRVLGRHPEASFTAVTDPPRLMRAKLLRGGLDFFVAPVQVQPPDARIRTVRLGGQSQAFQVRPGHPLLGADVVSAEDLAGYPLVSGTVWNELVATLDPSVSRWLRARVEIDDVEVLIELVRASDAVLLFSVPVPAWGLESLPVSFADELRRLGDTSVHLHRRSGLSLSPPAEALADAIREEFSAVFRGLGLRDP